MTTTVRPLIVRRRGTVVAGDPEVSRGCAWLAVVSGLNFVLAAGLLVLVAVLMMVRSELTEVLILKEARLAQLPVPVETIEPGTMLTAGMFTVLPIDSEFLPAESVRSVDELVGRTVRERLLPGEAVRFERLAPANTASGLNAIVPAGQRAVSINLLEGDRVGGTIQPGNYVDLLVTLPDDYGAPAQTITVAEAVRVLTVDQHLAKTATGETLIWPQVTLAIPVLRSEEVVHAVYAGKAKLALRADIDLELGDLRGAVTTNLLGSRGRRMSASEFGVHFDHEDVERWTAVINGTNVAREPVVDPDLLRGIGERRVAHERVE